MFRALLWKEWRELWMLPVAAIALVCLGLVISRTSMAVGGELFWGLALVLFSVFSAVYIPAHLFARDKELDITQFVFSKPIDRFRLWWTRLVIGFILHFAVCLIVFIPGAASARLYPMLPGADLNFLIGGWNSICLLFLLFCLSMFTSAVFKRKATAIIESVLILFLLWIFWFIVSARLGRIDALEEIFSRNPEYYAVGFLLPCPALLFGSLAVFARGNVRQHTGRRVAIVYGIAAAIAIIPTAAGFAYLSPVVKEAMGVAKEDGESRYKRMFVHHMSDNGKRILMYVNNGEMLISLDLAKRLATVIDRGNLEGISPNREGDLLVYGKIGEKALSRAKLCLTDVRDNNKKELLSSQFGITLWMNLPDTMWSLDSSLLGLAKSSYEDLDLEAYLRFFNSSGEVVAEYVFSEMEGAELSAIGWDSESRFYFRKEVKKRDKKVATYWRVRPDNMVPEQLSFIPDDECIDYHMSPDGRWMLRRTSGGRDAGYVLRVADIGEETDVLVSENTASFGWSRDGRFLVYIEDVKDQTEPLSNRSPNSRLMLYEPATRKSLAFPLEQIPDSYMYPLPWWSPSDTCWFLSGDHYLAFSLETRQFVRITMPESDWRLMRWSPNERLLWMDGQRLITTEPDGSNPEEVFRIEDGRMYLYGEEQS